MQNCSSRCLLKVGKANRGDKARFDPLLNLGTNSITPQYLLSQLVLIFESERSLFGELLSLLLLLKVLGESNGCDIPEARNRKGTETQHTNMVHGNMIRQACSSQHKIVIQICFTNTKTAMLSKYD